MGSNCRGARYGYPDNYSGYQQPKQMYGPPRIDSTVNLAKI